VVGFICVFSHGAVMKKNKNSLTKDEILTFLSLLVIQTTCPKTYNSIGINSFEIVVNLSM
jgi:hypothetical protein